ncbi:hypothetical protein, partial [Gemmiger formicilis]|uniref:hypothetical protein n=1 Tax=Gemmiger formicilis TaxID=745368 RepID=UPI0039914822
DTANKKPRSRVQAPLLKKWQALDRAFLFCLWQTREKRIAILYSFSNNFRAMNLSQVLRLFIVKVQSWKALILAL